MFLNVEGVESNFELNPFTRNVWDFSISPLLLVQIAGIYCLSCFILLSKAAFLSAFYILF